MFTPADLEEISFERSAFGGYKLDDVESFVNKISGDYVLLYNENEDLKKKLKLVVDKVESYRAKETLISEALLSAQSEKTNAAIEAERIKSEALGEAEKIRADIRKESEDLVVSCKADADVKIAEINAEIEANEKHLEAVKKEVSDFKQKIQELYKVHLTTIMAIPTYEKPAVPEVTAAAEASAEAKTADENAETAPTEAAVTTAEAKEEKPSDLGDIPSFKEAKAATAELEKPIGERTSIKKPSIILSDDITEEDYYQAMRAKQNAEKAKESSEKNEDGTYEGQQSLFNAKSGLSDVFDFDNDDDEDAGHIKIGKRK